VKQLKQSRSPSQRARAKKIESDLYLRGYSQHAIKDELKTSHSITLSQPTICRDLKEIQDEWVKSRNVDISRSKIIELQKIDRVEREFWAGWERSYGTTQRKYLRSRSNKPTIIKTKTGSKSVDNKSEERTLQEWELAGDPRFLFGILQCIERRCKVLGIEEPGNVNIFQGVTFAQFTKQYFKS